MNLLILLDGVPTIQLSADSQDSEINVYPRSGGPYSLRREGLHSSRPHAPGGKAFSPDQQHAISPTLRSYTPGQHDLLYGMYVVLPALAGCVPQKVPMIVQHPSCYHLISGHFLRLFCCDAKQT